MTLFFAVFIIICGNIDGNKKLQNYKGGKMTTFFTSVLIIPSNELEITKKLLEKKKEVFVGLDTEFIANKLLSIQISKIDFEIGTVLGKYIVRDQMPEEITLEWLREQCEVASDVWIKFFAHYSPAELACISDLKEVIGDKSTELYDHGKYANIINKKLKVSIIDTLGYIKARLEEIGKIVYVPKVDLQAELERLNPGKWSKKHRGIEHFDEVMNEHPGLAKRYAMTDSYIALLLATKLTARLSEYCGKLMTADATPKIAENVARRKMDKHLKEHYPKLYKHLIMLVLGREPHNRGERRSVSLLLWASLMYKGGKNKVLVAGEIKIEVYDLDLQSAYPNALRLICVTDHTKPKTLTMQQMYKMSRRRDWMLMQGYVRLDINFTPRIKSLPIGIKVGDTIIETIENQDVSITLVTFLSIMRHYRDYVNWSKTHIKEAVEFPPVLDENKERIYPYRAVIDDLVALRNKAKKEGNKFDDMFYKLILVSIYGKLAQGISNLLQLNFKTKEHSLKPYSKIFNGNYAAYVTDIVRILVTDAANNTTGLVLNVVTDGFMIANTRGLTRAKLLEAFENSTIAGEFKAVSGKDDIWEVKHYMPQGVVIVKVRWDIPRPGNYNMKDAVNKFAFPSGVSKNGDIIYTAIIMYERIKDPAQWNVKYIRKILDGYKQVAGYEKGETLKSREVATSVDYNVSSSMMPDKWVNNAIMTGVTFMPWWTLEAYESCRNMLKRHRNTYVALSEDAMKILIHNAKRSRKWKSAKSAFEINTMALISRVFISEYKYNKHEGMFKWLSASVMFKSGVTSQKFRDMKRKVKASVNEYRITTGNPGYKAVESWYYKLVKKYEDHLANMG